MNNANDKQTHNVEMTMRKHMDITGVGEVVSFDDTSIILKTVCGEMTVEGRDIKVGVLDTDRGVVSLDGRVDALYYSDTSDNERRGLFGRLMK